jgi:hypothetical protein
MNHRYLLWAALLALPLCDDARAQTGQTVEGAQEFLRLVVDNGSASTAIHFEKTGVTRTERTFEKVFLQGWVYDPEKVRSYPVEAVTRPVTGIQQQSACASAVSKIEFRQEDRVSRIPSEHHPADPDIWKTRYSRALADALAPPVPMDWSKVAIARGGSGVQFAFPHPKFGRVLVTFSGQNVEMLERIEYAGRFLQMSCEPAAGTGF